MSIVRANRLESIDTTNGGIDIDASGHVQVDGVQMPTAGPLSNRNLIINGAMQVAQRGTSQTTSDYGTVDRFFPSFSGGAVTTTQESLTSGDPYDAGFRNFVRLTNTTTATGASNYRLLVQNCEAQNIANSGWNYASATSYVTLSFWIRSSVSQAFSVRLRALQGTEQNYPMSTGTLTANTWTKVTKTIPGNSNITMNNTNGAGLRVEFAAFWGTNYTDSGVTLDTWAAFSSSTRTTDMTNTWAGTTDATFDITGVQLEVGSVATPFEHRSYGDELARCQRYHLQIGNEGRFSYQGGANNTNGFFSIAFPTKMRATPSFSYTGSITVNSYTASGTVSNLAIDLIGPQVASIYSTGGVSYSTSTNTILYNTAAGNGELLFSAEL